jgi:hypothetical protein
MAQRQRQVKGETRKQLQDPLRRRALPGSRFELDGDFLYELFDTGTGSDEQDEDDMPDDETTNYMLADDEGKGGPFSTFDVVGEEFFTHSLPQMVHIIARSREDIRVVTHFKESKYAPQVLEDIRTYITENRGEIISLQNPEFAERIFLDDQLGEGKYNEIKKNLRDLYVLLPNLHIIRLREIYKFRRESKNEARDEEILQALERIYRELEPVGDFRETGELITLHIRKRIKGVKGHEPEWGLYVREVKRFFEAGYTWRPKDGDYKSLAGSLLQKDKDDKMRTFLERYGEELWHRLKRR